MKKELLQHILARRRAVGMPCGDDGRLYWHCEHADEWIADGFCRVLGERTQWLSEYDEVAQWLASNEGKGLLMIGNVGRGKTLLAQDIIPQIFIEGRVTNQRGGLSLAPPYYTTARNLATCYGEALRHRIIIVDDIGTEHVVNVFGEHHDYVSELILSAYDCRPQKVLILSTNLNKEQLFQRYSDVRVTDRLLANTKRVWFEGTSLRGT